MEKNTSAESGAEPNKGSLPPKMWRDDADPVAQVAKKYEIALREQSESHEPLLPWHKRLLNFAVGGVVGIAPGAILYGFLHDKPKLQILPHTVMTMGTIIGLEVAKELQLENNKNREKGEAHSALADARKQARSSYAQSIARGREESDATVQAGLQK